mmetsp:Transcript_7608/g.17472  ORF Transcript_7608/g.17472 Transcript_7608/m.17472 type:complete len:493 (+) Transcript_7608:63-1541(+)
MVAAAASGQPNTKSVWQSIMLLLAAGIGSGVMVLPRAMAAVGPELMITSFIIGWMISSLTTWILFSAVVEARSQPELIMSVSSRLLSASSPRLLVALGVEANDPQATNPSGTGDPISPSSHTQPLMSPPGGSSMERRRSTSFYDYKDIKGKKGKTAPPLPGPSYADLVSMASAPMWMTVLDLVLLVHQQLALTVYFLFISQFIAKLPLPHPFSALPPAYTIPVIALLATPLAQLDSVGGLARLASISPAVLFLMMISIVYRWHVPEPHMVKDEGPGHPDAHAFPAVFCIAVFSFMWHTNCVTVARELKDPSPSRCLLVVLTATTVLLVAYIAVAYFGYLTFGQKLCSVPTIMMLYEVHDTPFMLVRFGLSISLFVAIPLNVYPVRESVLSLLKPSPTQPSALYQKAMTHQGALSAVLVCIPAVAAYLFQDVVTQIITCIGGSLVSLLMIGFPVVIVSRLVMREQVVFWLQLPAIFIVLFLMLASLGLVGRPI